MGHRDRRPDQRTGHLYRYRPVDRWGRKPTLILGFIVMAAGMGVLGSMMHIGIHSATAQYFAVLMLLMFIVGFAMSAGPLIWVLCSEIQPLKGRDFGITCSTATNWIANMIVGATFLTMLNSRQRQHLLGLRRSERAVYPADYLADSGNQNVSLEHIERNLMQGRRCAKSALAINPLCFLFGRKLLLSRAAHYPLAL